MKILEVLVVTIVSLLILLVGVLMIKQVFQKAIDQSIYHQVTYPYASIYFTELQIEGKAKPFVLEGMLSNKYSDLECKLPASEYVFGGIVRFVPSEQALTTLLRANTKNSQIYYSVMGLNSNYNLENSCDAFEHNFYKPLYGNSTIAQLNSPMAYSVILNGLFTNKTKTYGGNGWNILKTYGVNYGLTLVDSDDMTMFGDKAVYYPSGNSFFEPFWGSTSQNLYFLVKGMFPFNTVTAKEQLLIPYEGSFSSEDTVTNGVYVMIYTDESYNIIVNSTLTRDGQNISMKDNTISINGYDYTMIGDGRNVFSFGGKLNFNVGLNVYYGEFKIENIRTTTSSGLEIDTYIPLNSYVVIPPISKDYAFVPKDNYMEIRTVFINIVKQKKWWIFTIKKGDEMKNLFSISGTYDYGNPVK